MASSSSSSSSSSPISFYSHERIKALSEDVFFARKGCLFRPNFKWLRDQLNDLSKLCENSNEILPKRYQTDLLDCFKTFLEFLGEDKFKEIFSKDEKDLSDENKYYFKKIPEIADALLQRNYNEIYYKALFDDLCAFQAIVSDLYQIAIQKVESLVQQKLPPLVKWAPSKDPHTHPTFKKHQLNLKVGVVSFPPGFRTGGILAWGALGHEVVGHNFLNAIPGLLEELKEIVVKAVGKIFKNINLQSCTEEMASDVLGTLAMGPMIAVCLLGYSRGGRNAGKLSNEAIIRSPIHLPDILRVITCTTIITECFEKKVKQEWPDKIMKEVCKDKLKQVTFKKLGKDGSETGEGAESHPINFEDAKKAVEKAALAIATEKLQSLKGKSLNEIICWQYIPDETKVDQVRALILRNRKFENLHVGNEGIKPRHVVAGAIMAALDTSSSIEHCFSKMKEFLLETYHRNTFWCPEKKPPAGGGTK